MTITLEPTGLSKQYGVGSAHTVYGVQHVGIKEGVSQLDGEYQ
jgi:hypothetical protein